MTSCLTRASLPFRAYGQTSNICLTNRHRHQQTMSLLAMTGSGCTCSHSACLPPLGRCGRRQETFKRTVSRTALPGCVPLAMRRASFPWRRHSCRLLPHSTATARSRRWRQAPPARTRLAAMPSSLWQQRLYARLTRQKKEKCRRASLRRTYATKDAVEL